MMGLLDMLRTDDDSRECYTARVTPLCRDTHGQWFDVRLRLTLTRGMALKVAEVLDGCRLKVEANVLRGGR